MRHYQRLALVEIAPVFQAILDHASEPNRFPASIELSGARVGVSGLRLLTFAQSPLCCSDPQCKSIPTHFAIERNLGNPDDGPHERPYHLNLYGVDVHGHEVMFTHDHTHARGLGGEDRRENTTSMCLPCNRRKGVHESQEANRRHKAARIARGEVVPQDGAVSEKRLDRQRKMFDAEWVLSGLSREAFVAFCHEEAMKFRQAPLAPHEAPDRRKVADALGLSVEGYIQMRHMHNQRMVQIHAPQSTPKPAFSRRMG